MINGQAFIQLAGRLAATASGDEAAGRSAVSRAYYGAFHLALAFLRDLGITIPANAYSHAAVQRYLIGSGQPDAQQAGMSLASLHSDRIRADYRLDDVRFEDVRFARLRVALACDVQAAIQQCRQDENRPLIKAGIAAYRQRIGE